MKRAVINASVARLAASPLPLPLPRYAGSFSLQPHLPGQPPPRPNLDPPPPPPPSIAPPPPTQQQPTPIDADITAPSTSSSSSSGGGQGSQGSPILYILLATAAIGAGNYFLLPSPSAFSNAARSKLSLEPHRYNRLPLLSTAFYPSPSDPTSVHKHLQILLPLAAPSPASPSDVTDELDLLRIRSVYLKEPALQIERAYTPLYDTLPGSSLSTAPHIHLIIKRYADGELGRYAHRLVPGQDVEVRGPVDTWNYTTHHRLAAADGTSQAPTRAPDEIVLLVGGTGITPAYQLITSLLGPPPSTTIPNPPPPTTISRTSDTQTKPKLTLLYAVTSPRSALLLPQLHSLASTHPDRLRIGMFSERLDSSTSSPPTRSLRSTDDSSEGELTITPNPTSRAWYRAALSLLPYISSSQPTNISSPFNSTPSHLLRSSNSSTVLPVFTSRITSTHIPPPPSHHDDKKVIVLVCGPDGMVRSLAGSKARDGINQGPLAGCLKSLGYREEDVFKL